MPTCMFVVLLHVEVEVRGGSVEVITVLPKPVSDGAK